MNGWIRTSALALLLTAAGCQSTVYLMPTPEAMRSGKVDPFEHTPDNQQGNRVPVAYATNRLSTKLPGADPIYSSRFDEHLRLGIATIRVGDEELSWDDLRLFSTTAERRDRYPLKLESTDQLAEVATSASVESLSREAREFFAELNRALAESYDKNLTLYVHGANNGFYRSTAQAAQYRHFTGRHSVVMVFAWPSAASLLKYDTDVRNAAASVPAFVRLLELLAAHSDAEYINILAYSAGAQVVSPGLARLREAHAQMDIAELRARMRLGEVYYAAPDVDFEDFIAHLRTYIGLPENVSLALNLNDTVLGLAAAFGGTARAGRPPPRDQVSAEDTEFIVSASNELSFDVIEADPDAIPGLSRGAHDFWYNDPWVSTDVLIQFLYHARPEDRGLVALRDERVLVWGFPPDYPERAIEAVAELDASRPN